MDWVDYKTSGKESAALPDCATSWQVPSFIQQDNHNHARILYDIKVQLPKSALEYKGKLERTPVQNKCKQYTKNVVYKSEWCCGVPSNDETLQQVHWPKQSKRCNNFYLHMYTTSYHRLLYNILQNFSWLN